MHQGNLNYIVNDSVLTVKLPSKIDFATSDLFASILEIRIERKPELLILDFSKTSFITLPGTLFLLAFLVSFKDKYNRFLLIQIKGINEKVTSFFMSIGFFSILANRIGIHGSRNIIDEEAMTNNKRSTSSYSIILPITSILYSPDKSSFREYTKLFTEKFKTFFYSLSKYPIYNFIDNLDDFQEMYQSAYEISKNIFDHSESEGFGAIHASSYLGGTTIAFFDTGIGIAESVNRSKVLNHKDDIGAIKWALIDGNSSKIGGNNQGHGFTILRDFCDSRNGILTIRTKKYLFIYKEKKWTDKVVLSFPGTQIVIYNPTILQ